MTPNYSRGLVGGFAVVVVSAAVSLRFGFAAAAEVGIAGVIGVALVMVLARLSSRA